MMRRLLSFVALFALALGPAVQAQQIVNKPRGAGLRTFAAPAASYDSDAITYFTAMSVQPDATRKGLINDLVVGLKGDGVWIKLQSLFLFAAHDAQAARLNMIAPGSTAASAVNAPTFTTDRGYAGDGTSSYLNTNVNDATGLAQQDSVSFGAWVNALGATNPISLAWWSSNSNRFFPPSTFRVHDTGGSALSVTNVTGLYALNRSSSSATQAYLNGAANGTGATTSTAPSAIPLHTHKSATSTFSSSRLAAVFTGGSLNSTEQAALYTRLNTFLSAIGAN